MATLTSKITLTSTDATSDTLSMSVSKNITVGPPAVGISKVAINAGGGADTVLVASSAGNKYVYVKHTGYAADGTTATSNEVIVEFGGTDSIRLSTGEWAFFPAKASTVVEAVSNHTSTILVEYAYWTAA